MTKKQFLQIKIQVNEFAGKYAKSVVNWMLQVWTVALWSPVKMETIDGAKCPAFHSRLSDQ